MVSHLVSVFFYHIVHHKNIKPAEPWTVNYKHRHTMILPLHLQTILVESCSFDIVVDNAKSHISLNQGLGLRRRYSAPLSSSPNSRKNCTRSLKRTASDPATKKSRWESEAKALSSKRDSAPCMKLPDAPMGRKSLHNVFQPVRPVRRQSIEDPELLAQLHDSVSSIEGLNDRTRNTAALLAMALDSLDFSDDDL